MESTDSRTVKAFFDDLPLSRAKEIRRVRDVVRAHLPAGYQEAARSRMLVYEVPLALYADTYNGQPLWYAALAAPKTALSLHLMPVYSSAKLLARLKEGFQAADKKLRMGKACIHFQSADELALDVIGEIVAAVPPARWVEIARAASKRH